MSCEDNERMLSGGGGFDADPAVEGLDLVSSMNADGDTWRVRAFNKSGGPEDLTARIICLGD